jgi:hypothetical protein
MKDWKTALELRDPSEWSPIRPADCTPQWQRILHRHWQQRRRIDRVVAPVKADRFASEKLLQHFECLVEHLSAKNRLDRLTERTEFRPPIITKPDPADQPSLGKSIECRHLTAEYPRAPSRQWCDERAEANALRHRCDRGHHHPRIGHCHAWKREHVVPEKKPIPPSLLHLPRQLDHTPRFSEFRKWWKEYGEAHRAIIPST